MFDRELRCCRGIKTVGTRTVGSNILIGTSCPTGVPTTVTGVLYPVRQWGREERSRTPGGPVSSSR